MHFETELNIQNTLSQKNQSAVIKWTEKQLYDDKADSDQKISALIFLFHAGQQKKAFSYIASCFKENKPIPWRIFMIALYNNSVSLPKKFLKNLYDGALETHNLKNLALVPQSQSWGEEFKKNKEDFYKTQEKIKKEKIYDQIDFFHSHKLHEEEKKQLLKAAQLFPQDSRIKQYKKKLKTQWASQIINRNTYKYLSDPLKKKENSLHEEEKKIIDTLFENSQKVIEQTPSKAYDMALFFYFMDQHKYALSLVRNILGTPGPDWLFVELLLLCRHFVECLEEIKNIEKKYSNNPETAFSAIYIQAQALWGLGDKNKAISLIKEIIKIRPNYRCATSLLTEWEET